MNLGELFPGVEVVGAHLFRVIRDTDMRGPPMTAPTTCSSRSIATLKELRHGTPSLLQVEAAMPHRVLKMLVENFEIDDDIVVRSTGTARASPTGWRCTGCRCPR